MVYPPGKAISLTVTLLALMIPAARRAARSRGEEGERSERNAIVSILAAIRTSGPRVA